jgi:hypothetical protein
MPSPVYPDTNVYIDLDSDGIPEENISSRIVSNLEYQHGITSYKDVERLSNVGNLSFTIIDIGADDTYEAYPSYYVGKSVSIKITLGVRQKQVFFGYVSSADEIESGMTELNGRHIKLTVLDWMNVAQKSRIGQIALATFVTADEALPTLLDATSSPPTNTNFDNGFERFPNMFDGALQRTTIYSELDKITKSELGHLYLKFRDISDGETLRFENYLSRGSGNEIGRVPSDVITPSLLKYHGNSGASGYLKFHGNSGASGRIKLAQAVDAAFGGDNTKSMIDSNWEAGKNVINQMSVNNIPRKTDATPVVLYNINSPIEIGTGTQGFQINGSFTDPNGGTLIQAKEVNFADTDWAFNSAADGSGTDLKPAGGIQVNFNSGTNSFSATFSNNGVVGFLTSFQVRGKGIYKYNQIETLRENVQSQIDLKNIYSDSLTREYSNNYNTSMTFADSVLAVDSIPRKVMRSVTFVANTSEHLALAFMYLEQGSKVHIIESRPPHTGNYYIQGIKSTITLGGIIYYTWYLKEDIETIGQPIAVRNATDNSGTRTGVNFGVIPYLANLPRFSYSLWVMRLGASPFCVLIARNADDGVSGRRGNYLILSIGDLTFDSYKTPTDGRWTAASALPSQNVWYHVVVTYDNTTDAADAEFWVNGSKVSSSEINTPVGKSDDDSDLPLMLFNIGPNPSVFGQQYFYGTMRDTAIKDVRIYNHILSSSEISELYNNEDDYSTVQDGILFQGIYAPSENIDNYINDEILENKLLLDSVYGAAGTPYNEDISADTQTLYGLSLA